MSLDLRRKAAQRRTIDEREYYRNVLSSLLVELRSSDPARINELVNFIRSDASMGRIATVLADTTISLDDFSSINPDDNNPSVENAIQRLLPPPDSCSTNTCSRITLESLVDIPLFQVPAKPWTNVTDDDNLVSHLISLYFTWDHPCWQLVDQKIFLLHMKTGDRGSQYCTPFLVNSILAMASVYSDAPGVFAVPGNAESWGSHFYMEAERLWRAEEGTISLVNIQSLVIMCHVLKCQGKNGVSWLMLRQAVQLAQDFGMFRASTLHANWEEMDADMQRSHAIAAWGIFVMNLDMSMELHKDANLEPPVCKPYSSGNLNDDIAWTPYPRSNQIEYANKPGLLRYVATEISNLTEVTAGIQQLFFMNACHMDVDDLWTRTNEIYSRLQQWRQNMPDVLKTDDYPVPQVLFLRLKYHKEVLSLFNAFLGHKGPHSPSHPAWFEQIRLIRLQSAKDIARCFGILRLSYGYKRIPSHMLEAAGASLLVVMGDLTNEESGNAFFELCRIVMVFGKRLKQAKCMIAKVISVAQQSGIILPPEAVLILESRL